MRFLLAIVLPFMAVITKHFWMGLFLLLLQLTVLGWVPAAIVAVLIVLNDKADERHQAMHDALKHRCG